ncbi:hypothetical protein [Frankia sp. Cas3]|uniref:hypothetical protein n=1 Tax=Frankia sp. Cas3 TaxID=3073926 RepID=UPI002AD4B739|nr:hypothetical protein [Frankia sp. Cas3]
MRTFILYGSKRTDIGRLANEISVALGVTPDARDSSYIGEYYSLDSTKFSCQIQQNLNSPDEIEEDDRYQEPDHRQYDLLVRLTLSPEAEPVHEVIGQVRGLELLARDMA